MASKHSQDKVQIIICSYNRAMQLEALLDSIRRLWTKTSYELVVLYETSSEEYERAYEILKGEYPEFQIIRRQKCWPLYPFRNYFNIYNLKLMYGNPKVRFQPSNVRSLINNILKNTDCKYCMFSSDDEEFLEEVDIKDYLNLINSDTSLYLSKGAVPENKVTISEGKEAVLWDKTKYDYGDWGYRFDFDVSVMLTEKVYKLLSDIVYNNPSTLEANVSWFCFLKNQMKYGVTIPRYVALNHRLNLVQNNYKNKSVGIPAKNFNERFLEGYRLRYLSPQNQEGSFDYPNQVFLIKDGIKETIDVSKL